VIEGSDLLVATGRAPNTDGIGLEATGVERDERGFIKVDERLRTTAPGVWAVGDCAGSPFFTHIGDDDVRVVRDNLAGIDRVTTGRLVPFCLFTDPELARIGLSESEARSRGIAYRLANALHGVARCDPGPPDDGGRARQAFPGGARQALTQSADTYRPLTRTREIP
jgi:pyruvate/2-oxoglutarate dehydrogenase complex dihydrolipoamide dehydrogenase (E3) component